MNMGTPSTTIHRVKLIPGFLEKKNDKSNCDAISFEGDTIPEDIIEAFRKDDYLTIKPRYGDPSWGTPIQYDHLIIEDDQGTHTIEIYNRGILLLTDNTEETRRAHRIIYAVEKYIEED